MKKKFNAGDTVQIDRTFNCGPLSLDIKPITYTLREAKVKETLDGLNNYELQKVKNISV